MDPLTVLLELESVELESVLLESVLVESVSVEVSELEVSELVLEESVSLSELVDELVSLLELVLLDESVLDDSEPAVSDDVVDVAATTGTTIAAAPTLAAATSTVARRVRNHPLRLPSIVDPLVGISVVAATLGGLAAGGRDARCSL